MMVASLSPGMAVSLSTQRADEHMVRKAHGRVATRGDELTAMKADAIVRGLPEFCE
jgi:hypothetical protein